MVNLLIATGDTLKKELTFTKANPSFVFIVLKNRVYYLDTTIGKVWLTDKTTLKGLGLGHKKLIKKAIGRKAPTKIVSKDCEC